MLAIGLGLLVSLCWGLSDFLGGLKSRSLPVVVVLTGVYVTALFCSGGAVLIIGEPPPPAQAAFAALTAGIVGLVGLGAFYHALAIGTMSIVAPIAACGVALPVLVGIATGDRPSTTASIGLPLAILGVVLATRRTIEATLNADPPPSAPARQAVLFALVAAAGIGGYLIFAEIGSRESVAWTLLISRAVGASVLLALVAAARQSASAKPTDLLALALIGVLDLSATALYGLASTLGPLSLVAVASSLYPVVTVLLAAILLGESLRRLQRLGVVLTLVGVALIASG